jgi:hypothetical protein
MTKLLHQPVSFEAVGSVQEISVPSSDDKEIFLGISIAEGQGKVNKFLVC